MPNARLSPAISTLLDSSPQLWRGREPNRNQRSLGTGYKRLDQRLPGGGWPLGALTELITASHGLGEFSLLFPVLAELSQKGEWLVLVDPPWVPYPAALLGHGLALERLLLVRTASAAESLWAIEQALRGSRGGAVLAWPELIGYQPVSFARLRRLQLAAEAGAKPAFLFRPESTRNTASPAALRLYLQGAPDHAGKPAHETGHLGEAGRTRVQVLKSRGQHSRDVLCLPGRHPPALRHTRLLGPADSQQPRASALPGQQPGIPASTVLN